MTTEEHELFQVLRTKVENTIGFEPKTPKEFTRLEREIFTTTRNLISASTLKRFWGYNGDKYSVKPSRATLNVLCDYIGYISWDALCASMENGVDSSGYIHNQILTTRSLRIGDVVRLQWRPDRCVIVRYDGLDMFTVTESANSKLCVGDRFMCTIFVQGEQLVLTNLIQGDNLPVNYACGKDGGITFTVRKALH
jgi:hypothetical protein